MKSTTLVFCLAAAVAAHAQTAPKPSAPAAKPATAAKAASTATAGLVKYPPGRKADLAPRKTLFSLRVQDLKVGTGPAAEPMKMYKLKYTGWRAADGVIFDSWDQHPTPVVGEDGKPEMGPDGKPKTSPPQPVTFPVGMGRMIPGFDQGFAGMHVGGIRRIFVPWQLGYGTRAMPDRGPDHPGIPAKSDLVFEVELIEMTDLPMPPNHPMPGAPGSAVPHPSAPGQPPTPPPSGAPPTGSAPATPPTPPPTSQPSTPPQPK